MVRFLKRYFWIWSSNRKGYYRECKAATGRDCHRIAIPGEGLALILNCAMGAPVSRPKVNEAVTSPPKAAQDAVDRTIENSLETPDGVVSRLFAACVAGHISCSLGLEGLQVRKRLSV
jgi:hypothetical protein